MKSRWVLAIILVFALFLRLYQVSAIPPSLNWDEASLGYNAFSIAQTLRDEHGEFLPVARFIAFGDYKPPVYIYLAALAIKVFGLSDFSVRLASVLAGTGMVLLAYLISCELFKKQRVSLLAATLVAISPWAIFFSRGAFEANLATFLELVGIYLFIKGARLRAAIFFALTFYTFNSYRIFTPLIVGALSLIYWPGLKKTLVFGFLLTIFLLPIIPHLLSSEGKLRFYEVTWLNDLAPIDLSISRKQVDGNSIISKIIHNRRIVYLQEFLQHYTDDFRAEFLFYSGDVNPRLSVQGQGEMYWVELPLLLVGLYTLLRRRDKPAMVLLAWIFLAPIPGAFARETPHALRSLQMMPALLLAAALGLSQIRWKGIVIGAYIFLFAAFLHNYFVQFPRDYAVIWQYGYKQAVEEAAAIKDNHDRVVVTGQYGRPYIYFLLYSKYPPEQYWQTRVVSRDNFGFWDVSSFDKYIFGFKDQKLGRTLYVLGTADQVPSGRLLKTITAPDGSTIFSLVETN